MANAILMHNLINAVSSNELYEVGSITSTNSAYLDFNVNLKTGWSVAWIYFPAATINTSQVLFYSTSLFPNTNKSGNIVVWATSQFFTTATNITSIMAFARTNKTTSGVLTELLYNTTTSATYSSYAPHVIFYN